LHLEQSPPDLLVAPVAVYAHPEGHVVELLLRTVDRKTYTLSNLQPSRLQAAHMYTREGIGHYPILHEDDEAALPGQRRGGVD
jgi:hypothetical protein